MVKQYAGNLIRTVKRVEDISSMLSVMIDTYKKIPDRPYKDDKDFMNLVHRNLSEIKDIVDEYLDL